jgi:multicomponent Na+:H+ antiporter subunit B
VPPASEAVRDTREAQQVGDPWHRPVVAALVVAALAGVLFVGMVGLPRELAHLPAISRQAMQIALPQWGTTEAVNEIVYGTRGFDTFGETFLLIAAVITVGTLARSREPRNEYVGEASAGMREQAQHDPGADADPQQDRTREAEREEEHGDAPEPNPDRLALGEPAPEHVEAMTVIVRVAARAAATVLAVAGIYLAAWGYSPGGGFPAGAAISGVAILLYAALGRRAVARVVRPSILEPVEMIGAAAIVAVGILGLALKGSMFANWVPLAQQQTIRAGGDQQLYSAAELIEVATGLTIAVFALLGMGHDWTSDADEDRGEEE